MTMHQYPPNQADAIILVTIPAAYDPVTIFNDAIPRSKNLIPKSILTVKRSAGIELLRALPIRTLGTAMR